MSDKSDKNSRVVYKTLVARWAKAMDAVEQRASIANVYGMNPPKDRGRLTFRGRVITQAGNIILDGRLAYLPVLIAGLNRGQPSIG